MTDQPNHPTIEPTIEPSIEPTIEPRHEHHELSSGVTLHCVHWDAPDESERPWLLVHGLASNSRLWDGVARRLAQAGHRVVAVDQRGHGRSSKPDHGFEMATVADDLELLIDGLGFDTPGVAGQSWGGNVVLELAHRHAGLAAAVACLDGGFIELQQRFPDWADAERQMAPPRLIGTPIDRMRAWMADSASDWPEEGRAGQLANFEVRDDGTIAPWLTFERHLKVLRGLWEHSPAAIYPTIQSPVLLIPADTGDVRWTNSKRDAVDAAVAALPTSRVEWFSPAHHDVHAQHPAEVAALLHRATSESDFFPEPPQ